MEQLENVCELSVNGLCFTSEDSYKGYVLQFDFWGNYRYLEWWYSFLSQDEIEELWVEMNSPLSFIHGEGEEYQYLEEELYYNP